MSWFFPKRIFIYIFSDCAGLGAVIKILFILATEILFSGVSSQCMWMPITHRIGFHELLLFSGCFPLLLHLFLIN